MADRMAMPRPAQTRTSRETDQGPPPRRLCLGLADADEGGILPSAMAAGDAARDAGCVNAAAKVTARLGACPLWPLAELCFQSKLLLRLLLAEEGRDLRPGGGVVLSSPPLLLALLLLLVLPLVLPLASPLASPLVYVMPMLSASGASGVSGSKEDSSPSSVDAEERLVMEKAVVGESAGGNLDEGDAGRTNSQASRAES